MAGKQILMIVVTITALFGVGRSHSGPSTGLRVTVGQPEIVMDYSRDSCRRAQGFDLPDVQSRAVRSPLDESLILISGNAPVTYTMGGPDFNHLRRICSPALVSGDSPDAFTFDNQEWIVSVYREGDLVHALIHNEYHDPSAPNCRPGVTDPSNPCWYNAITYAVSTDGGRTFSQPPAPDHVVAALPIPWNPDSVRRGSPPPHGYFSPSNIVRHHDGSYYDMFFAIPDPLRPAWRGTCLMRTDTLNDPKSWRAWDGQGFTVSMPSPYDREGNPAPTGGLPCAFVSPETIGDLHGSLTFNTYLDQYILVGSGVFPVDRTLTCGTFFSLSSDLISWSSPQLIMQGKLPYPPCTTDGNPYGSIIYPSLIDHSDGDPNFTTTGRQPYLYYVIWNQGLDRDLVRVPLMLELEP